MTLFAESQRERRKTCGRELGSVATPAVHTAELLARAMYLARDQSDAWDLVQDTLERALRRLAPENPQHLRRWLLVVLHNLYLDRCRRARRYRNVALTEDALVLEPEESEAKEPAWRSVDIADVRSCLERLDPRLREAYLLQAEQGLCLAEVASRLGVPMATAGTRVFRARRRLRQLLQQPSHA
jgi:RNA polymerase sigma-70 factor (ECF subfamily)